MRRLFLLLNGRSRHAFHCGAWFPIHEFIPRVTRINCLHTGAPLVDYELEVSSTMGVNLDHIIVEVKDVQKSIAFYCDLLGFRHRPDLSKVFTVIQVNENLGLDLLAAETVDSRHLAFCMDQGTFDSIFAKLKQSGIPYGDNYQTPDNMKGPGQAPGTRGMADTVYFHDPSGHLLEIRHYPGD